MKTLWLILVLAFASACVPSVSGAAQPVSFAPSLDFATGANPYMAAIGDFNNDGWPDLVVVNSGANSVSVLLGTGAGGFGAGAAFGTGPGATSVAIADVNLDGALDVATANYNDNTVSVLLGNGAGALGTKTDFAVGGGPYSVAFGDLNGDGRPDLAAVNFSDNTVSVLLGDGVGGFGSRIDFGTGPGPLRLAVGDLNGDSRPDVAVANHLGNTVSVLLGDGTGGLGAATDFAVGGGPWWLAIGDVDLDGSPDVVTANYWSGSVSVLRGDGTGGLGAATEVVTGGHPTASAIADLNLDGQPDVAVVVGDLQTVSVLLGDGSGGFGTRTDLAPVGSAPLGIVIGDLDLDGRPDLVVSQWPDNVVSVLRNTTPCNTVAAQAPATCITPAHPCVPVPVAISRADATPLRAYSVTLHVSSGLALCDSQIVEGTYLANAGHTTFLVVSNGGGSYTVDCAILGIPCGATSAGGELFHLKLGSGEPTGTGTVVVDSVRLRDCDNAVLPAVAGLPASISIDNSAPAAITTLVAAQQKTGNDADGTTRINLAWTATEAGSTVEIYRQGFGHYPDYDEAGGAAPTPAGYPPAGWTPVITLAAPAAAYADEVTVRDFYYYVAYVIDGCGNVSAASNRTNGTLNYHLGDVAGPSGPENQVTTSDVSMLGLHYGVTFPVADPLEVLDVGPTTDYSVNARPTTDHKTNFEDLMMFGINYGRVSKPGVQPAPAAQDVLALDVSGAETVTAKLVFAGTGRVQGISARLGWNPAVVEPWGTAAGELLAQQDGVAFSAAPGTVDAALLGSGRGISGEGTLAVVSFRRIAAGDAGITLAAVDARDTQNRRVDLAASAPRVKPVATGLRPVAPNPFRGSATLEFALAAAGDAELSVYSVAGRLVRTLVSGAQTAGSHRVTWDGTDARGGASAPGIYFARLRTFSGTYTRSVVLLK